MVDLVITGAARADGRSFADESVRTASPHEIAAAAGRRGCEAWPFPDRPTLLAPAKEALAITPASTRRTHIFVVTGRNL